MKKRNNGSLNDFTAWQWELAIVASRFHLHLLSDVEIIAFTHRLMDKGFYDDLMLDIIDDDPLYPSLDKYEKFVKLWQIINFPIFSNETAKYFNTLQRLYPFIQHPIDFDYFLQLAKQNNFYATFEDLMPNYDDDSPYIDLDSQFNILYTLDDDLSFYLQQYITAEQLGETLTYFSDNCTQWLTRNQSKIIEIMYQLFPK